MKKFTKRFLILFLTFWVSVMIPFMSVQATVVRPSVKLTSDTGVSDLVNKVNYYCYEEVRTGFIYFRISRLSSGIVVSVDTSVYKDLSLSEKQDVMSFTLSAISDSSLVVVDKTKLYNFVAETDSSVSAVVRQLSGDAKSDFYSAYSLIKPFSGKLGTVLAILCILLFLGIISSMLIDIGYLAIPLVHEFFDSDDNKKPKLVTVEAYKSYLEGVKVDSKKDVLVIYLKKKYKQIIAVCILILYLAGGKIWAFLADIIDLFSGFVS